MSIKTAVIFKTHFWDSTVDETFRMCTERAVGSDIYIYYDNSNGTCLVPQSIREKFNVFLGPYSKVENIGLEWGNRSESLGGYWYNGDYHQNIFVLEHPEYEYICSIESDVAVCVDIDNIFLDMENRNISAVYKIDDNLSDQWPFLKNCSGYYDSSSPIQRGLFCISFFSREAAFLILRKRLEMSEKKRQLSMETWPIGEAVMAHEIYLAGLKVADISHYCDSLVKYDCAPCYLIEEARKLENENTIIHPVSAFNTKFVLSNFQSNYNSLISRENIIEGKSLERAKEINKLEVYARLYHSKEMKNFTKEKSVLIREAREKLDGIEQKIILDNNNILSNNIIEIHNVYLDKACVVFDDIPSYNPNDYIFIEVGSPICLSVPSDGISLVLSAREQAIPNQLQFDILESDESISLSFYEQIGELNFFATSGLKAHSTIRIQPRNDHGVWINFIKFIAIY